MAMSEHQIRMRAGGQEHWLDFRLLKWDCWIVDWVVRHQHDVCFDILRFFSRLGTVYGWLSINLLYFLIFPEKVNSALGMLWASIAGLLFSQCMKRLFQRPRPWVTFEGLPIRIRKPRDTSFPSGHAVSAASIATAMLFLEPSFGWVFVGMGIGICLSRVYLMVHYASDVMLGALVGISIGAVVGSLMRA